MGENAKGADGIVLVRADSFLKWIYGRIWTEASLAIPTRTNHSPIQRHGREVNHASAQVAQMHWTADCLET